MPPPDRALPTVFTRAAARAAGLTDRQVDRHLAAGRWRSLQVGYLTAVNSPSESSPLDPATLAALLAQRREVVLSHEHAARAYGWPRPLGGWGRPTATATSGPTRNRPNLRVVVAPCPPQDVRRLGAVRITTPARTLADCLRHLAPHDGLAMADAALRRRAVRVGDLVRVLDRCAGWPGAPRARRVAAVADGRRETPLESWSAWAFVQQGVPAPAWQVEVADGRGVVLARVDAWWGDGVAGEADGRAKYRMAAEERGGADAARLSKVLDEERARERRLRGLGAGVVRWNAEDVLRASRAAELARQVDRELSVARARGGFRGMTAPWQAAP